MPAKPQPERDAALSPEALEASADLIREYEPFLNLLAMLLRVQVCPAVDDVAPEIAALETLSHILEADARGTISLSGWNKSVEALHDFSPEVFPTVRVPLWVLSTLGAAWGRYRDAETGVSFDRAFFGNNPSIQGQHTVPRTITMRVRDFSLAHQVIVERVRSSRTDAPLSKVAACEKVAAANDVSLSIVETAYTAERLRVMAASRVLGIPIEAPYSD